MSIADSASPALARGVSLRTIGSFALIGGIGFLIEAVLLSVLTKFGGWTPWQARVPSFLTAVLVTWALNRRLTFRGRQMQRSSTEAALYVGIQTCGALINLAVFGVVLHFVPRLVAQPVIPLACGAVAGFAFNFLMSNGVLYAHSRAART